LPNDRSAQHFHFYTAEKRNNFFIHKYSLLVVPVYFAHQYAYIVFVRLRAIQVSTFRKELFAFTIMSIIHSAL